MAQVSEREDDPTRPPRFGGRRMEDQLVGWRLGQLENSVDALERSVSQLRDDLISRTSLMEHSTTQRDLVIRVGVWFIGIGQLATTILLLVTR